MNLEYLPVHSDYKKQFFEIQQQMGDMVLKTGSKVKSNRLNIFLWSHLAL